jgi:hypothetical protein
VGTALTDRGETQELRRACRPNRNLEVTRCPTLCHPDRKSLLSKSSQGVEKTADRSTRSPGFPVEVGGVGEAPAAFFEERRIRGPR